MLISVPAICCLLLVGAAALTTSPLQAETLANHNGVAAATQASPTPVAELEGIVEYRLKNGVQVLLFPDPSSPTTTVNVVYRVGSAHETYGETGLAHLLEHMMFKGTTTYPNIPGELSRRGMRWNASTSFDRTHYFSTFLANRQTLDFAISLEADRMVNSTFAQADLTSEMTVVRNEFETGENNAFTVLKKRVLATAFDWHAYGRPTIGARSDIEHLSVQRLQDFYRVHYRPDNATVMVAGRFNAADTLALIAQKFESLPNPAHPIPVRRTAEPTQEGERAVTLRRVGQQPMLFAAWHTPAVTHPDTPALVVMASMLDANPGGDLFKRLVDTQQATGVATSITNLSEGGWFSVAAHVPTQGDPKAVLATVLDTMEGRSRPTVSAQALSRVKNDMTSAYAQMLRSPESVVMMLTDAVPVGDWRMVFALLQGLQAVTVEDVERVAKTYFKSDNRTVGEYIPTAQPDRVEIAVAPPVADAIKHLGQRSAVVAGEVFEATPQNLEARTHRTRLPSGIQLATLSKQNRGNSVTFKLRVDWAKMDQSSDPNAWSALNDLLFEGTPTHTRQQQLDTLTALHAKVSVKVGAQGLNMAVTAERDTLLGALELAADAVKHPLLQAELLARNKAAKTAEILGGRQHIGSLINQAQRVYLNEARQVSQAWDPRYIKSTDELIQGVAQVTINEVRRLQRELVAANGARVTVVGSVPDGLEAAVEKHFGRWTKPLPTFKRFTAPSPVIVAKRFDVQANDKANAELSAVTWFSLSQRHADFEPLLLAIHIFGGTDLQSRLSSRIRQREGLSYGVKAALASNYFDDRATLTISGSFAPENRDQMLAAVTQEMARARRDGFTDDELTNARRDLLERRQIRRSLDSELADVMLWQLQQGQTFEELRVDDAKLNNVTLDQMNAAFRKYIDPDRFVTVVAGDFDKHPQKVPQLTAIAH